MPSDRFDQAYVPDVVPDEDLEFFEKSGYGARMGWGDNPAVLVVDMTKQFASSDFALGRSDTGTGAVEANEKLLSAARESDLPIIYTVGPDERCNIDAYRGIMNENREVEGHVYDPGEGNEIVDALAPESEDVVIEKPGASAFMDTHLSSMLRYYDIDTLIITGMTTSGCVRASVVDAYCQNVYPIVPIECVADRASLSHEVALFDMDMKYADVTPLEEVIETVQENAPAVEATD